MSIYQLHDADADEVWGRVLKGSRGRGYLMGGRRVDRPIRFSHQLEGVRCRPIHSLRSPDVNEQQLLDERIDVEAMEAMMDAAEPPVSQESSDIDMTRGIRIRGVGFIEF